MDFLVINRSFEKDKQNIERYFESLMKLHTPFWFVIYCEGHRITEERIIESQKFCSERGIKPYTNVLCPRYKGFDLIVKSIKDSHIKKLLDLTFYCTRGAGPSLCEIFFSGEVFEYKNDFRIIDIEDIQEPVAFLEQAFRRKDGIIGGWKKKVVAH